ncbi:hypothetical protein D3C79_1047260 [compost metagenome]
MLQGFDDAPDFLGRNRRTLGQVAHLVGDHGKATALFAGAGGFDGGIQGQQVGLFGNAADHFQHAANLLGLAGQYFDRVVGALQA